MPVHRLHDEEIERLLVRGERRAELVALLGPSGYRELRDLAGRAAAIRVRADRRVYVLPGLMGSRIGTRGVLIDDVLWLDPVEVIAGHLVRLALPRGARLAVLGAMLVNALKLKLSLAIAGFDARMHAYDWRRDIASLATELNDRIEAEGGRDVMLVGHSMGGVVARVALGMQARDGIARVVQLGAPNLGSFAPVLALRGVYPTVRKLAALDLRHSAEDLARIVFRTLPALHELLPAPSPGADTDLFDPASWPDDALRPEPGMLATARAARDLWPHTDSRCLHIAGVRQDTVIRATRKGRDFEYFVSPAGDGTVPLELARLPGQRAWFVAEKHGGLPNNGKVIAATVDLLRSGETARLAAATRRARAARGHILRESTLRRVAPRKLRWQELSAEARRRLLEPVVSPEFHGAVVPDALVARRAAMPPLPTRPRRVLELRLAQGSIVEANARALVLGLFRNVDPSGPAAAVDRRLGGVIHEFALRRMFTGTLGQVFMLPAARSGLLAECVLFAGLGDFDHFGEDALSFAAENVVRTFARTRIEDFATVLFGAGSGVPVARALELELQGFLRGVRQADPERVLRRITICEIDPRRYTALRTAARRLADRLAGDDLELLLDEAEVPPGLAAAGPVRPQRRRRTDAGQPDPAYLLVTLREASGSDYECRASLLTAGAKAAVLSGSRAIGRRDLQRQLASADAGALTTRELPRFGAALARTLLAQSVREGLDAMRGRPLVVVHDREASRIPWETLRIGDASPALEGGVSRRYASETLTVARWREDRAPGAELRVLLVTNPTEDLPGAATEGEALQRRFERDRVTVEALAGRDATRGRVLAALRSGTIDVLHFAGHGFFDPANPAASGLVCAGREVLRGADLGGLGDLPALVFFNACEAARVRRPAARSAAATPRLFGLRRSSSLAEAFLGGGVANFLGTHWPVGDEAALAFSTRLYSSLLEGASLGGSVLAARRDVAALASIDWADYVHYGNPAFRLVPGAMGNPTSSAETSIT